MKKITNAVERVQLAIGGICLATFLFAVVVQIVTRYLKIAVVWTQDVSTYAFIWAVFMGASAMVNEKQHFAFTSLGDKLKGKPRHILGIVISVCMMVFTISMIYYGTVTAKTFWNYNWITLPKMKMGPTWLCVPFSGACMTFYLLCHVVDHIRAIAGKGDPS